MNYPDREATIKALLDAARAAAENSGADHPCDIAVAMTTAIEPAGEAVHSFWLRSNVSN